MSDAIVRSSRYPFVQTVDALTEAIAASGATLFAAIDQSEAARGVGLTLRPTTLVVFGNPRGGTPLMEAFPLTALDLPLKVLVWEEHAAVSVAYVPVTAIAIRYAVTGKDTLVANLNGALEALVAHVT